VQAVQATLVAAIAAAILVLSATPVSADESDKLVLTIAIDGAIGPVTAGYVKDALDEANAWRAEAVIVRLNTPGGLVTSKRNHCRRAGIARSRHRLCCFVQNPCRPALELYPTHIAVMAPATYLDAATPTKPKNSEREKRRRGSRVEGY
jgi:membrane-bound serine protease (ClpP class)